MKENTKAIAGLVAILTLVGLAIFGGVTYFTGKAACDKKGGSYARVFELGDGYQCMSKL